MLRRLLESQKSLQFSMQNRHSGTDREIRFCLALMVSRNQLAYRQRSYTASPPPNNNVRRDTIPNFACPVEECSISTLSHHHHVKCAIACMVNNLPGFSS